jgi:hypothetical protein
MSKGRPRLVEGEDAARIGVTVPDDLAERFSLAAVFMGLTKSELFRLIANEWLTKKGR